MPFHQAPDGVARLRLTFTQGQAVAQNILYFQTIAEQPLTVADLDDIVDQYLHAFNFGVTEGPRGVLASSCVLSQVEAVALHSESAPGVIRAVTQAGLQSNAEACPPGVAVVVTENTGLRGRNSRGRVYVMGIVEGDVGVDGLLFPTPLAAWQERWTNFITGMADSTVIAGNWMQASFFDDGAPRGMAIMNAIQSVTVRNHVRSQRRRNP